MQATVVKVCVANGDRVTQGDMVCVLEAMKMEQSIVAHRHGVVRGLEVRAGDSVAAKQLIFAIDD
jgi:acetyl-CoA/propionyl-CoA carboxylase biotin carboxyl carrier protein